MDFQNFFTAEKPMKFATNPCVITHITLGMLLHYLGKLIIQIFADIQQMCKRMQTNCIFIASNFVIHLQIFIFFGVYNSELFSILVANKVFHVTVLLLVYFRDQFVAPEIRLSRRHCGVCQQSTWYLAIRTKF